jgi:hypothetical protein
VGSTGQDGLEGRHPATLRLLKYFSFAHLPLGLQPFSAPFSDLAYGLVKVLPDSAELTAGLRKLLEAKDCVVRAAMDEEMLP